MTELLLALVGVLNVAVGALAWQLRRNGKNNSKSNVDLHDAVKVLYSIDGKMDELREALKREAEEEAKWHVEVRDNFKDMVKEIANIPKRGET